MREWPKWNAADQSRLVLIAPFLLNFAKLFLKLLDKTAPANCLNIETARANHK
jgi:hypothetical protein